MRRAWLAFCAATVGLLLAACAMGPDPADDGARPHGGLSGPLSVFAAASLTDAFADIADAFTTLHPGVQVTITAAGAHILARQITEGAPADVFASSDVSQMRVVQEAGNLGGRPEVFAGNVLEIAVEVGNPLQIRGLGDLEDPRLTLVLPAEQVPAGAYARQALDAAGVTAAPASLAEDVRAALSAVVLGEADAALVYASDVAAAAGRVDGVAIPAETNVSATYPIAVLDGAANPEAARAFVDYVLGDEAQAVLADHGFTAP